MTPEPRARAKNGLLLTGIAGTLLTALCCFTPVLVAGLAAVGLSAWLGWLDYVLIPALIFFVALTAYALWRRKPKGQGR